MGQTKQIVRGGRRT